MFLDNIRLYVADWQTGLLEMRYICHCCGKEITGEPRWQLHIPTPGKYKLLFWCDDECRKRCPK